MLFATSCSCFLVLPIFVSLTSFVSVYELIQVFMYFIIFQSILIPLIAYSINSQYNSILKFPSGIFIWEYIIYLYTLSVLKFIYFYNGPCMECYHLLECWNFKVDVESGI